MRKKLNEIEKLLEYLEKRAERERQEAKKYKDPFEKGLAKGYADAYKLTAEWIAEVIKD